jgi:hypothetical protein
MHPLGGIKMSVSFTFVIYLILGVWASTTHTLQVLVKQICISDFIKSFFPRKIHNTRKISFLHTPLIKWLFEWTKLHQNRNDDDIRGCIQKFPDWPPGARTANDTALCHYVQLCRYFVSQSSEFCRYNPLCCFSSVYCCCLFLYRLSPETFGYALV